MSEVNRPEYDGKENIITKIPEVLDRLLDIPIILAGILVLLFSLYAVLDTHAVFQGAAMDKYLAYKPEAGEAELKDLSEDAIGWLCLTDTEIDYPVMQGRTNSEYINKDPYGDYSLAGSIFLDCRNTPDFSDDYNILYGHHMAYNAMFGGLDLYRDTNYLLSHRKGKVYAGDKELELTVFSWASVNEQDPVIFEPDKKRDEVLIYLRTQASFFREPEDGQILALSTCSEDSPEKRTVVFGTILKKEGRKEK